MTEKSEQLIKRLTQMSEGILDYGMPRPEKRLVQEVIHETCKELKDEVQNMSKEEKADAILQLTILISIIQSSLKEQGIL